MRIKVYKPKKDFNKSTRKKHRLYRNILINKIVESEKNDPNEIVLYFSSHSMSIQGFFFLQTFLFFFFSGPTSLYETFKAAL
jgi:hypothetical protein